jgi:hypothetical protein
MASERSIDRRDKCLIYMLIHGINGTKEERSHKSYFAENLEGDSTVTMKVGQINGPCTLLNMKDFGILKNP